MRLNQGISAITLGLMLAPLSFAALIDTRTLSHQCMDVAYQLKRLSGSHHGSVCAGDVKLASAYIEATSNELYLHQIPQALHSISYGENELKAITNNRNYCIGLAPEIKPYLANIIVIKSEMELLVKHVEFLKQN
jgi:predicted NAD/FAD-binding protein